MPLLGYWLGYWFSGFGTSFGWLGFGYWLGSSFRLLGFSLSVLFGLPSREAMACGCPVITSNVSSLPEVVGDAGILVDPRDAQQLAEAMKLVLTDSRLRREMIEKGLARAKKFTWEKTAQETLKVYQKVMQECGI